MNNQITINEMDDEWPKSYVASEVFAHLRSLVPEDKRDTFSVRFSSYASHEGSSGATIELWWE